MSKLDTIDRPDDLYLLLLEEAMTMPGVTTEAWKLAKNGLYRSELKEQLEAVDLEPFPFDEPFEDYADFMDTLEFFNALDFIGRVKEGQRMGLTEKGRETAEQLADELTDEQREAIQEVADE